MKVLKDDVNSSISDKVLVTVAKNYHIKVKLSDDFYFTYINQLRGIFDLTSKLDISVLAKLCNYADDNYVSFGSQRRKEVCESFGVKSQNISNSLTRLRNKGLITGKCNEFYINESVLWKGSHDARKSYMGEHNLSVSISIGKNERYGNELID